MGLLSLPVSPIVQRDPAHMLNSIAQTKDCFPFYVETAEHPYVENIQHRNNRETEDVHPAEHQTKIQS